MAQTPSYYVNSPVSGTQYWAPMGYGLIPRSAENITVTVKAWTGANGTGSLIQVTTLACFLYDQTTATNKNSNSGNFNTVTASSASWNGTDWCKPSGKFTGAQSVGSLEMFLTYTNAASLFIPTTPSFSPSAGGVGTSVTLTGSHFTDATICRINGVDASFTVNSDTSITATVPAGATTGVWTVGNAEGATNSSSNFLVANAYILRSSVWTPGVVALDRSSVQTTAQGVFVYRSGVWTSTQ